MTQTKYRLYATNQNGDGRVMAIGDYDHPTEIVIIIGMFDKNVVLTIEEVKDGN